MNQLLTNNMKSLQSFGYNTISGQPAIFQLLSHQNKQTWKIFNASADTIYLQMNFYINGFQKPLQLSEIIVELPFM